MGSLGGRGGGCRNTLIMQMGSWGRGGVPTLSKEPWLQGRFGHRLMCFASCSRVQIPVPWHHKGGPLGRKFRRSRGLKRRPIANVGPPQTGFAATGFGAAGEFIAGFSHRFGEPKTLLNLWDPSVGTIPVAPTLATNMGPTDSDLEVMHIG